MSIRALRLNNILAFQLLKLFRFGSALLVSILLAKSSLSTLGIAHYEYLLYLGTTVSFFWVNALLEALLAQYPGLSERAQKRLLFNVFGLFSGISLAIFILLQGAHSWIVPWLTELPELPYFNAFCFFLLFNLPSNLTEYIYLLRKQPRHIVIYAALMFGSYVLAVMLPLWLGYSLAVSIWCIAVLAAIKYAWLVILVMRPEAIFWQLSLLRPYLIVALPLIAYTFVGGFAQVFDNWLVNWYFQSEEVFAIFRYGARELPLATALAGGLYAALVPEVASDLQAALKRMKIKGRRIFHWVFPVAIVLMLTSAYWYPLVFNPDFAASSAVFNVYLLVVISRVLLPSAIMMGLQQTRSMLGISLVELLLNMVLSVVMVHYFGIVGVAMATVLAFLFEKLALMAWLQTRFGIKSREYIDWPLFLGYSLLLLISYWWSAG